MAQVVPLMESPAGKDGVEEQLVTVPVIVGVTVLIAEFRVKTNGLLAKTKAVGADEFTVIEMIAEALPTDVIAEMV